MNKHNLILSLRRLGLIALLALTSIPAYSSPALDSLRYFFNEVKTFQANFGQEVMDESMQALDSGRGRVTIKRPGLFFWDYEPPEAQQIIGDGDRVWIYDVELEQVTVRDQQQSLGKTPALILAGTQEIEANYTIIDIGTQGRFDWVNLIPVDEESGFTEIRIGFEDNRLRLMELLDNLGQRTRMSFVDLRENEPIPDTAFDFVPPAGVDVIDESGN